MRIRKYIISDGAIIQGLVEFHAELREKNPGGKVAGGGMVHFDEDNERLYLYGQSVQFGPANMEDVTEAIKTASASMKMVDVYFSNSDSLAAAFKDAKLISVGRKRKGDELQTGE